MWRQLNKKQLKDQKNGTAVLMFPDDGFKYVEAFERYFSEGI